MEHVTALLRQQDGVIARRQLLDAGLTASQIRSSLRRHELAVLLPGIYVTHTGGPTWLERAWGAVLHAWPAALCHASALRAEDGPGRRDFDDSAPIHVAIERKRNVVAARGVVVHRLANLDARTHWQRSPPRLRIEEAVIDVAAEARRDVDAVAVIADAVGSRRTTAARIRACLDERSRVSRREFLVAVLDDVADGTCSVLEHAYLTRVERAHGLPRARRQVRSSVRGPVYRDVVYERFDQIVELDGRLDHSRVRDRDADLDRDLAAAVDRMNTVRLGWGQVLDRPCWTAMRIARLLTAAGWRGQVRRCSACGPSSAEDHCS